LIGLRRSTNGATVRFITGGAGFTTVVAVTFASLASDIFPAVGLTATAALECGLLFAAVFVFVFLLIFDLGFVFEIILFTGFLTTFALTFTFEVAFFTGFVFAAAFDLTVLFAFAFGLDFDLGFTFDFTAMTHILS
jgi:hypothetical protein